MSDRIANLVDKVAAKVFKHVTDAKVRTLYHRAKTDKHLAAQLKDLEDNVAQAKDNIKKMADLLKQA